MCKYVFFVCFWVIVMNKEDCFVCKSFIYNEISNVLVVWIKSCYCCEILSKECIRWYIVYVLCSKWIYYINWSKCKFKLEVKRVVYSVKKICVFSFKMFWRCCVCFKDFFYIVFNFEVSMVLVFCNDEKYSNCKVVVCYISKLEILCLWVEII